MVKSEKKYSEKKRGFMDVIKDGLSFFSQIISSTILPSLSEGAEMVMDKIEDRIMRIEERIMRKIIILLMIGFGALFLIFSLLFFLKEYLHWSNFASFFSIGITIFVIGLLLKIKESDR